MKQSLTEWMIGCSSHLNNGIGGHAIRAQEHTTIRCLKRFNLKQAGKEHEGLRSESLKR